jgi:tellurite resistance protein TerC
MIWIWLGFLAFILLLLALDLGVFHREAHVVSLRESMIWSAIWIALGLSFTGFVYIAYENHWMGLGTQVDPTDGSINNGAEAVIKYLTGYIVEKSLSIDNVFVIAMVFAAFAVPAMYQHRVLFWGVVGALVMRGGMIALGSALITRFHWLLYVFGVLLLFTGLKMLFFKSHNNDPRDNFVVRLVRRWLPVSDEFDGQRFVTKAENGRWLLTPLALALVLVETTDLIFAVDSIPAIFAITADPFLVFTSNVFALLGLRSLYFALAHLLEKFYYLKVSLALVLMVVGGKMLAVEPLKRWLGEHFHFQLLAVILGILVLGVVASWVRNLLTANSPPKSATQE